MLDEDKTENSIKEQQEMDRQLSLSKGSGNPQSETDILFSNLLSHALFGYFLLQDGRFKLVNPRMASIFGYQVEELLGDFDPLVLIHPDHHQWVKKNIQRLMRGYNVPGRFSFKGITKQNSVIRLEASVSHITFQGKPSIHGSILQIGEHNATQQFVENNPDLYRQIIDTANEGIWILNTQNITVFANRKLADMLGYTVEEMLGKSVFAFMDEEARSQAAKALAQERSGLYGQVDFRFRRKSGAELWTIVSTSAIYDKNGHYRGVLGMVTDITDRKRAEEQLLYLTSYDSLTGLYNRSYFWQMMSQLDNGRHDPVGIIVCDLDGLKLVNDTVGHKIGDTLIAAAARVIKSCFREDDIVAHIGGDEFAILMLNTPQWAVENACHRIRRAVKRYNGDGPDIPLSLSIGYAVHDSTKIRMDEVFEIADSQMYRDKLNNSQAARVAIVQALMRFLNDNYFVNGGHNSRSDFLAAMMAAKMNFSPTQSERLRMLAQFHDLGKVRVSEEVLFKPARLTPEEFQEVKKHCEIGQRIALSVPDLAPIADLILKHHEWWNGKGYPLGLKGEEIPLECRIVSIIDAYEAMTNDRPYRKALPSEAAIEEIRRCAGTQFDPELVLKFLEVIEEINSGCKEESSSSSQS